METKKKVDLKKQKLLSPKHISEGQHVIDIN